MLKLYYNDLQSMTTCKFVVKYETYPHTNQDTAKLRQDVPIPLY